MGLAMGLAFASAPVADKPTPPGREEFVRAEALDRGSDSVAPDTAAAMALYRESARLGYAPAQNFLGFRMYRGEGTARDLDSALYWLAKAAGQGDLKAASNLGWLLANGDEVARDYGQAVKWLAQASEGGVATASAMLADMLRAGLGTEPDTARATELYVDAARHGVRDAQYRLAAMMHGGWKTMAADSQLNLGRRYYFGGLPVAGVTLFGLAAEAGNPDAMALLGDAKSKGLGTAYDHEGAMEYFLRGALGGNATAQFVVAEQLEMFPDLLGTEPLAGIVREFYGGSIPVDIYTARYWYAGARKGGVTDAAEASASLRGLK